MKVGIVGCGLISGAHIRALRRDPDVQLIAVCDSDPAKASRVADDYGIPHSYGDVAALLDGANGRRPEVVHILTPPRDHYPLTMLALQAGCHVLVEKPMALDVREASAMAAAARRLGLTLSVCHNHLYDPAILQARELVARGALGRIIAVEVFWGYFHGWQDRRRTGHWMHDLPGGHLQESAPHPVYLLQEFLPEARVVTAITPDAEAAALGVMFAGASGPGTIALTLATKPYRRLVTLHGTQLSLTVDLTNSTLVKFQVGIPGSERQSLHHGFQLVWSGLRNAVRKRLAAPGRELALSHRLFIEAFYRSLRQRSTPPVTAEAGQAVVAALDQVWAAL